MDLYLLQGFREWVPGAEGRRTGRELNREYYEEVVPEEGAMPRHFQENYGGVVQAGVCGGERGWVD